MDGPVHIFSNVTTMETEISHLFGLFSVFPIMLAVATLY